LGGDRLSAWKAWDILNYWEFDCCQGKLGELAEIRGKICREKLHTV